MVINRSTETIRLIRDGEKGGAGGGGGGYGLGGGGRGRLLSRPTSVSLHRHHMTSE